MTKTEQRILKQLLHGSNVTIRGRRETLALRDIVPLGVTITLLYPDTSPSYLIVSTRDGQSTFEGWAAIDRHLETLKSLTAQRK